MLRPVKCKNTVETAIENIGDYIARNLNVGDILPSERDLAEQLCISRNITREALQHFRTLGILESKPKKGAVVARLSPGNIYEGFFPFIPSTEHSFQDLVHLRLMLELGCAERAVNNITPENLDELYCLCEKCQVSTQGWQDGDASLRDEMFKTDMEFHTKLIKFSGNALMESLIPLVVEFFSKQYLRSITSTNKGNVIGVEEHFRITDALKSRNQEELSSLIRSHINRYYGK